MSVASLPIVRRRASDFIELTKPRITFLVSVTALVGYWVGSGASIDWTALAHLLIGTALSASGGSALNQYIEREHDAKMRRTMSRPIPTGRILPSEALWFGTGLTVVGCAHLWVFTNALTALLALATVVSYIGLYTPSKRVTSLSTVIGAIPGALPPLGGWAAARGTLHAEAFVLFSIVFLWQVPHFLAIAWMFREDYAHGGFPVLPVLDTNGTVTGRQIALATLALVPISLAPSVMGFAGVVYFVGALVLGAAFLGVGVRLAVRRTVPEARRLLLASVAYLPLLFGLLMLDRVPYGF
ncbi:protoheme IX farnesyltransferase [Candidatus Poribacteria bacterium]|nr:protoheme IX farnesyltransferase [Candidatus Poribacteria bacterium]